MKIISVANQKGGVGKTTLSINFAVAFALMLAHEANQKQKLGRVLVVDMDPQVHASATFAGGVFDRTMPSSDTPTLGELLMDMTDEPVMSVIRKSRLPLSGRSNLDYIPTRKSSMKQAEMFLRTEVDGSYQLLELLNTLADVYEYVFIDTPPNLGSMTAAALYAAHHVLIPTQLEAFSLDGVFDVFDTIDKISKRTNPKLKITGIQPTMCNFIRKEQKDIYENIKDQFGELLLPPISSRAEVTEANTDGLDIFSYRPARKSQELASSSIATQEFAKAANEFRRRVDAK